MPRLRYRALTRAGGREAGVVDAPTLAAASSALRERGLIVIDLAEGDTQSWPARSARSAHVAEFTRALASLLPAGLPLVRALEVSRDIASPSLQPILRDVGLRVERGSTFAEALSAHPRIFPASYVGLIRAGEHAGALSTAISRLADALERDVAFRARMVTAAIYPALLALVGSGAVIVLLFMVLPRFAALFAQSGSTLPRSTAIVLGLAMALRTNAGVVLLIAALVGVSCLWLVTAAGAAHWRERLLLAAPISSSFYREVLAARSARMIAMLLDGGAPLVSALDDAGASIESSAARDELSRIRARVREGARISTALSEGALFPPLLTRLVAVGEESSQLATFFGRAADLFEERVRGRTARLAALAEPALILLFGLIVGAIALALVQAIYGINVTPLRTVR